MTYNDDIYRSDYVRLRTTFSDFNHTLGSSWIFSLLGRFSVEWTLKGNNGYFVLCRKTESFTILLSLAND